jgi:hypothetical protein
LHDVSGLQIWPDWIIGRSIKDRRQVAEDTTGSVWDCSCRHAGLFASGDFSKDHYLRRAAIRETNAGKYTFIDPTHLKLDFGIAAEIYEVVGVTDKELRMKQQYGIEIWNRVP